MRICICGGGSLGHVCAGVLSSHNDCSVNLYTKHPQQWKHDIVITDFNNKVIQGRLDVISANAQVAMENCDTILLCLPGFLIEKTLREIKPYIKGKNVGSIVSSTGFFFMSHDVLGDEAKLFGFQRVPFIARVDQYGQSANLLGYKPKVAIATENIGNADEFRQTIETLFNTPTTLLNSFYEAALTNSNPILHTGRLYSLFHGKETEFFDHNILFYKEWTDESSQTLIQMDGEFFRLLNSLGLDKGSIPSLLEYYESTDAASLTNKIRSIAAFQNILSPMKETSEGWLVDFENRYFSEDFPFGLRFIKNLAKEKGIVTPTIDKVLDWGMEWIGKRN